MERRVDPQDGRSVHLYVTEKMMDNFARVQEEWVECMIEGLGEGVDVGAVSALLNALSEGLVASRLGEADSPKNRRRVAALG